MSHPAYRPEPVAARAPRVIAPPLALQLAGLAVLALGGAVGLGQLLLGLSGGGVLGLPDAEMIRSGFATLVVTIAAALVCGAVSVVLRGD